MFHQNTERNIPRDILKKKNKKMFVTGGIGTSVFPVRFNNFPEIIILNIKSDKKSE